MAIGYNNWQCTPQNIDPQWSQQWALAETKADSLLSCFDNYETRRSREEVYSSLVDPPAPTSWTVLRLGPPCTGDPNMLQTVQWRATKMVKKLEHMAQEEQLVKQHITREV